MSYLLKEGFNIRQPERMCLAVWMEQHPILLAAVNWLPLAVENLVIDTPWGKFRTFSIQLKFFPMHVLINMLFWRRGDALQELFSLW